MSSDSVLNDGSYDIALLVEIDVGFLDYDVISTWKDVRDRRRIHRIGIEEEKEWEDTI